MRRTGTGALAVTTSATAPPSPPRTECSSTVRIAPVFAASMIAASSSGLMVDILMTRAPMPSRRSAVGGGQRAMHHHAVADDREIVAVGQDLGAPDLELRVGRVDRGHRHAADAHENGAIEPSPPPGSPARSPRGRTATMIVRLVSSRSQARSSIE